jgi:hypothetical protein
MRLLVVSDPHYASEAEKARRGWELRAIRSPALRLFAKCYRHYFWLADPTAHNGQLDRFLDQAGSPDLVVANGDYSCDSGFIGLADDAAHTSARECLGKLRRRFGDRLLAIMGDHEFGKMSLFGGVGGPRFASWRRCVDELGLAPVWSRETESHRLIGVTSSLAALPVFAAEILPEEAVAWEKVRAEHQRTLEQAMGQLGASQRWILFCHDPTALPYLAQIPVLAAAMNRLDATILGHLHSELILETSRRLAGVPEISFLGQTVRRLTGALRKARAWKPFHPVLCPALAGIQFRRDGGFLEVALGKPGDPPTFRRKHLPW